MIFISGALRNGNSIKAFYFSADSAMIPDRVPAEGWRDDDK